MADNMHLQDSHRNACVDPELLILLFSTIGGLAGLAVLHRFVETRVERRVDRRRQEISRQKAWSALQVLSAAFHEWGNIMDAVRSFYEVGEIAPSEAEIRMGGAPVILSDPELARFIALTSRIHKCQTKTTKACATIQQALQEVVPVNPNEVEEIEAFRHELNQILSTFNRSVLAIQPSTIQPSTAYRFHREALDGIDALIREVEKALMHLQAAFSG